MAVAVRIIQQKRPNMLITGIGGATDSTDIFVFHLGYKDDINPRAVAKVYIHQYSGEYYRQIKQLQTFVGSYV